MKSERNTIRLDGDFDEQLRGLDEDVEPEESLRTLFFDDISSGLTSVFEGTVHQLSHALGGLPVFRGDEGVIIAWEFDGAVRAAEEGPTTFRGIGPLRPGTPVHFWGVHVFDQDRKVLRIVDEGPLRTQLGIVDAGRPLVEVRPPAKGD